MNQQHLLIRKTMADGTTKHTKRCFLLLLILLMLHTTGALASGISVTLGSIADNRAALSALIQDTGEMSIDSSRENVLEATITAADGSLQQTFRYHAAGSLVSDPAAGHARLDDVNFDGYQDLCFVTGQGARNVFSIFALWNEESGCFDPIMEICPWISEENRFADKPLPLELCCYELLPESRQIVSTIADGYAYQTITVYGWEGERGICEDGVASIFDGSENESYGTMIGERLELFATQVRFCWNERYPESWYYGQEGVAQERLQSLKAVMLGEVQTKPVFMRVRDDAWVNLRLQDSTDSRPLAKLDAGTLVTVLQPACGSEDGWVRVWIDPQDVGVQPLGTYDADTGITGYVWHSFLKATP